jgi:hypothetical protein
MKIKKHILAIIWVFCASIGANGQSLIKGNVHGYDTDLELGGINVIVIDTLTGRFIKGSVTDSIGHFRIDSIPNEKIDLQFSFIGCYNTIITDFELNYDTIEIRDIPIFEADCEIAWDGFCEKKLLWGLIKYKRGCGGTEYYEKSKFPANNQIYIDCAKSEKDSILFELNPKTKNIKIEYKTIKTCGNMRYKKLPGQ